MITGSARSRAIEYLVPLISAATPSSHYLARRLTKAFKAAADDTATSEQKKHALYIDFACLTSLRSSGYEDLVPDARRDYAKDEDWMNSHLQQVKDFRASPQCK
jgi:hypothetical protein